MSLILSMLVLTAAIGAACHYWDEFHMDDPGGGRRSFLNWAARGLGGPILLWTFFNAGLSPSLPPLLPGQSAAWPGFMNWLTGLCGIGLRAAGLVASFWSAVTFGWLTALIFDRSTRRDEFWGFAGVGTVIMLPVAAAVVYIAGWAAAGVAVSLLFIPIIHLTVADARVRRTIPAYSKAVAKMKFGKYEEAEVSVIEQLERCEGDFEGWMMLADLYANHFNDLPQADRTIRDLCAQPNLPGYQIATALQRLADWHLKIAHDPLPAARALAEIVRRVPGTSFAREAEARLRRLPDTRQEWEEQLAPKPIRIPSLKAQWEEGPKPNLSGLSRQDVAALANECASRLERNPNDIPTRERFARILAEDLGKVSMAVEQLELLIALPDPSEAAKAEWLSQIAVWKLRLAGDPEGGRKLLRQVIRDYPQTAQAFAAQRRLNLLEFEDRLHHSAPGRKAEPPLEP